VIRVRGLVKRFGHHTALRGVDLDVAEGERLALIGPNGAGKTTLLRILATLARPSTGSVSLAGIDLAEHASEVRKRIGFLSHQPLLYQDLTATENLCFYGRLYRVPDLQSRIASLLAQVGLTASRYDTVRTYSRGMRQRLAIARALLHDPPVLLMDEPYTGLDRQAASMLDAMLQESGARARTVILTTHNLERGLSVSERAATLVRGRIVYQMGKGDWDAEQFEREYDRQLAGESLSG
jgi:heme exporter protein A